jgi:hypothetical protein
LGPNPTNAEIAKKLEDYYYEELRHFDTIMSDGESYYTYYPKIKRIFLKRCWMLLLEYNKLGDDKWLSGGN